MKQSAALMMCAFALLAPAGCQLSAGNAGTAVAAGSRFPEFLVGTWDAAGSCCGAGSLKIVLAPDGTISEVYNLLSPQAGLIPNKVTVVETEDGSESVFKLGNCTADYTPATRQLTVLVDIEYFQLVRGPEVIKGGLKDVLRGAVCEDAKTWQANRTSYYNYRESFPADPNTGGIYEHEQPVIFHKTDK